MQFFDLDSGISLTPQQIRNDGSRSIVIQSERHIYILQAEINDIMVLQHNLEITLPFFGAFSYDDALSKLINNPTSVNGSLIVVSDTDSDIFRAINCTLMSTEITYNGFPQAKLNFYATYIINGNPN